MKKVSKKEAEKEINEFFKNIEDKSSEEIKKIKKLAMRHGIKLGKYRKKFCRNCYFPLKGKTRIRKKIKSVTCEECGKINRWKINSS